MFKRKQTILSILDLAKSKEDYEKAHNLEVLLEVMEIDMLRQLDEVKEQERKLQEDIQLLRDIRQKAIEEELM